MIEISTFLVALVSGIMCIPGMYYFATKFGQNVPTINIVWACFSTPIGFVCWVAVAGILILDNIKFI